MARRSAGLLMFRRRRDRALEVLLVHPGGPLWAKKDDGYWTIPKGEYDETEDALTAAQREFAEETGFTVDPASHFIELGTVKQKGGKIVIAWAVEGDVDAAAIVSNEFELPWPPKSGTMQSFPEVDRAEWFSIEQAPVKIKAAQGPLLERLREWLRKK